MSFYLFTTILNIMLHFLYKAYSLTIYSYTTKKSEIYENNGNRLKNNSDGNSDKFAVPI